MSTLDQHHASDFVKLAFIGDSGTGKTGALISLIEAGYKLRIIDMDNGLDSLVGLGRAKGIDLSSVQYETCRDVYKASPAGPKVLKATAFTKAGKLLDKWSDDTKPEEWGPDHVLVMDSGTHLGNAAFNWAAAANPTVSHRMNLSGHAQVALEHIIATITSDIYKTNVIWISHIDYRNKRKNDKDSEIVGYISSIGDALPRKTGTYFNTVLLAESKALGSKTKRTIRTVSTPDIVLKNPAFLDAEYPLETGMASIFQKLKGASA